MRSELNWPSTRHILALWISNEVRKSLEVCTTTYNGDVYNLPDEYTFLEIID
jgi:hypothetical protein